MHPETGALWSTEHGRQGGDEVNVILPGKNYGWPIVSYGRDYGGARTSSTVWQDGFEQPLIVWVPSIAITGIAFYTGDKFPAWKGNVFVGGLQRGRISRTGRLERIVFNSRGEEIRRESLLTELKKRVRDVRQGADGFLYVLVEDDAAGPTGGETALLRIEPASLRAGLQRPACTRCVLNDLPIFGTSDTVSVATFCHCTRLHTIDGEKPA